jgi:hypothetical protein
MFANRGPRYLAAFGAKMITREHRAEARTSLLPVTLSALTLMPASMLMVFSALSLPPLHGSCSTTT